MIGDARVRVSGVAVLNVRGRRRREGEKEDAVGELAGEIAAIATKQDIELKNKRFD